MRVIHLDIKFVKKDCAEVRYFFDNPNDFEARSLHLDEISDLIHIAEQDYYVRLAEDYAETGKKLYQWLDGNKRGGDRLLTRALDQCCGEGVALAIATTGKLAHLPWEVLHNGECFLIERLPAVVPLRWVTSNGVSKVSVTTEAANRALRTLFMATSPIGVLPELLFEEEEAQILKAKERQPRELELVVEESGCLSELRQLIASYGKEYFDIFHLTGHAISTDEGARFITETETGEAHFASASDIAKELQFRFPKLVFLSACRTGQSTMYGALPSMAEQLLCSGAKAVLGWGQRVLADDAAKTAATLYQSLSEGYELTESLARTYQRLIETKARDWHLLRLYVSSNLPGEFVKSRRTPGWKPAPPPSVATQFLDSAGIVKVPTRDSFVGRRRQLQDCLRALTQSPNMVGLLIHGMGGLGKSSLAARLCDRLPTWERVVWIGEIDEANLVNRLAEKLEDKAERQALLNDGEALKFRLKRLFQHFTHEVATPFLLIFDDFDQNLKPQAQTWILKSEIANVLKAMIWAIQEIDGFHRIIFTCRYDFESSQLQYFYKQPLDSLRGSDLQKKCNHLASFVPGASTQTELQIKAKNLADGNPRLLEWLDKILNNSTINQNAILEQLESDPSELQEKVLAEALLKQMDQVMIEILSTALVFELPVPRQVMAEVCENLPNIEQRLKQAIALGLLEVSCDSTVRVPRILPLELPVNLQEVSHKAATKLSQFWFPKLVDFQTDTLLEIHRLAIIGKAKSVLIEVTHFLTIYWDLQGRHKEIHKLCKASLSVAETSSWLNHVAIAEELSGNREKAIKIYKRALNICDEPQEKICISNNLADLLSKEEKHTEAFNILKKSFEQYNGREDIFGTATTLLKMGICEARQDNYIEGIKYYNEALGLVRSVPIENFHLHIEKLESAILREIGLIYYYQDNPDEAYNYCLASWEICRRFTDLNSSCMTLNALADIIILKVQRKSTDLLNSSFSKYELGLHIINDCMEGFSVYLLAFTTAEESGNLEEAQKIVSKMATRLTWISDYFKSIEQVDRKLRKMGEEAIDKFIQLLVSILKFSEHYRNLNLTTMLVFFIAEMYHYGKRDYDDAIRFYKEALELAQTNNDLWYQASCLHRIGLTVGSKARLLNLDASMSYFREALKIFKTIQDKDGQANVLEAIALGFRIQDKDNEAIKYFNQVLKLIGDKQNNMKSDVFGDIGSIYKIQNQFHLSLKFFKNSLELKEKLHDENGQSQILIEIGLLYLNHQQVSMGINYLQKALKILEKLQSPDTKVVKQIIAEMKNEG